MVSTTKPDEMALDQAELPLAPYEEDVGLLNQQNCQAARSVLVLDDDICFQNLMNTLLTAHGYEVWQARSAAEASAYLVAREPALIIVDYHLPGMDGLTWISHIREDGKTMPIIFVSGTWCDAKTFSWLRNILKVSLIFRKPIDPHLFLQSIEDVLPSGSIAHPGEAAGSYRHSLHSTDYADLIESANLDESLQKLDEVIASSGNNPVALHELTQIQRKLRTQKAVHSARLEYIARMSAIWKEMVEKVTEAQNNRNNHTLILLAFEAAHKFKGTSGSYGLTHISEIAGQMESFLKSIDPSCTKEETGIYWSEISHLLAEGTDIVQALTHIDPAKKEDQEERLISLLLVSPNDEYRTLISKTVAHNIDLHVVNSAAGAATRATSIAIDAAVIDLSLDIPGLVSTLTRSLRSIRHRSQLPFIFIANPFQYSNISELVYSGCSALLEPPVTAKALEDAVQCLRSTFKSREKRILCVDDDEMLTFFLSCVLNPEGYEVKSLHEPIHILETLESFQPDLILLDVMMPGLGGYEVCRMLRSHKEWSHIPIVFLTVKSDAESRSAAFQAGGNDFLAKPVVAQELITRVEAHLAIAEKEAKTEIGEVPDVLTWEAFRKQASRALQQCDRDHTPVSLGMIVIEGYAQLDDRHGGYSKQQVLAQLGYLLSIRFRITDIRGMWEDGAFAIMFPGESAATTAGALQLLQEEMAQTVFMCNSGDQFHITAAVGVSDVGADGLTLESLAKSALNRATNPEPVFKIPTSAAALRSLPTT